MLDTEAESVCDFLVVYRDRGGNPSQPPTKGLNINSTLDGFLTSGSPVALRQTTTTLLQKITCIMTLLMF